MEEENPVIEKLLYSLADVCEEFSCGYGNNLYHENVGVAHEYQYRQCLHLQCTAGNMLIIGGNLIVEISRSSKLEIDL